MFVEIPIHIHPYHHLSLYPSVHPSIHNPHSMFQARVGIIATNRENRRAQLLPQGRGIETVRSENMRDWLFPSPIFLQSKTPIKSITVHRRA
ncbi:hypothetical protein K505DRAFT_46376 [Melanomma pulvis-pyrius CBS 109.77]|uniref:Uncharacterized protein n=1 Tax=Melanomma pulvis-pyrius CBS 109.77 TaxID=1314802 RepID=A0A6A6XAU1_9PLEO|nr:hypothetical protein K505DRAFT_46376 [Melanomma pulvis-pyrius CBS 109.77]